MSALSPVTRRIRRFFSTLRAQVDPAEIERLREFLDDHQLALFLRMQTADQRHSINVFYILRRDGWEERDLLQAALLHDIGKSETHLSVWHRVLIDLGKQRSLNMMRWLARRGPAFLREPIRIGLDHGEIGAEAALRAGCSATTAALIRGTRGGSIAKLALALRIADNVE